MNVTGQLLIGSTDVNSLRECFYARNPANGKTLEPAFANAAVEDIDRACALAAAAFDAYCRTSSEERALFLDRIAGAIETLGPSLIERAMMETGLPQSRLEGERARTCAQLRFFGRLLRDNSWRQLTVDSALPLRQPAPRPDLRMQQMPLGPVAVFGASNFPLAFSVAGGDTASALGAGCPVIAKAHPAHPGTSELVGRAVREALQASRFPEGVFSMLGGEGHEVGISLVEHPAIQAIGFTGSRPGGLRTPTMEPPTTDLSSIKILRLHFMAITEELDAAVAYLGPNARQILDKRSQKGAVHAHCPPSMVATMWQSRFLQPSLKVLDIVVVDANAELLDFHGSALVL